MKIIYVENSVQNENTTHPQLIDGNIYFWKTQFIKLPGSFKDMINKCCNSIKYLLIYDVITVDKYFCDQGCQPGEGCKKDYKENNHAIMMSYSIIK
jgi:hypothetical protein